MKYFGYSGRNGTELITFFFLIYVGCPGQLARTTTIPHGPLDTLQAQEQVRHRGGDRRAHKGSNPGRERDKSHSWQQQLGPQVPELITFKITASCLIFHFFCSANRFFATVFQTWFMIDTMLVHGHGPQSIIAIMVEMDLTTSFKSLAINIDDFQRRLNMILDTK
jgi:hypothetical protein